jgi:putative endonuclease
MAFFVYILQSESTGKLYIGHTSDLDERVARHNSKESGSRRYTHKQMGPWELIYSEKFPNRSEAMKRERSLKSGKGREWIKDNIINKSQLASPPKAD